MFVWFMLVLTVLVVGALFGYLLGIIEGRQTVQKLEFDLLHERAARNDAQVWVYVEERHQRAALRLSDGLHVGRVLQALRYAAALERRGESFTYRSVGGGLLTESEFAQLRGRLIDSGFLVDNGARRVATWTARGLALLEVVQGYDESALYTALSVAVCSTEGDFRPIIAVGEGWA